MWGPGTNLQEQSRPIPTPKHSSECPEQMLWTKRHSSKSFKLSNRLRADGKRKPHSWCTTLITSGVGGLELTHEQGREAPETQRTREGHGCPTLFLGKFLNSDCPRHSSLVIQDCKIIFLPWFAHFPGNGECSRELAPNSRMLVDFLFENRPAFLSSSEKPS